jgi:hypothetical protein
MSADSQELISGHTGSIPTKTPLEMLAQSQQSNQSPKTSQTIHNPVGRLNELCQKRRWTSEYRIFEKQTGMGIQFKATVEVSSHGVFDTNENAYPSKRAAKDAVAQVAYAIIKDNDFDGGKLIPSAKSVEVVTVENVQEEGIVYAARLNSKFVAILKSFTSEVDTVEPTCRCKK